MNPTEGSSDADTELERFRREAEELGFSRYPDLSSAHLETADEFIERMREADQNANGSASSIPLVVVGAARSRARKWVLAAVGVAAAAALAVGVTRPGGSPAAAEPPPVLDFEFASAVRIAYAPGEDPDSALRLLSAAARERPDSASGSGEFQYKRSDNWYAEMDDSGSAKVIPRVSETWLRPDGSLTTHETIGKPLSPDGRGVVADSGPAKRLAKETLEAGSVPADFARTLPTEPDRLADALLEHSECESRVKGDVRSSCLYREILALSQTYVLSPALTAAIWDLLEDEPGFRSLGSVEDRAGRDAVGISFLDSHEPQVRNLLMGSLDGGDIVGHEEILIRRDRNLDVKPPAVLSFSTIVESRLTSTAPR